MAYSSCGGYSLGGRTGTGVGGIDLSGGRKTSRLVGGSQGMRGRIKAIGGVGIPGGVKTFRLVGASSGVGGWGRTLGGVGGESV